MKCIPVTAEELHFAAMAAYGAASGRTPRQSFESKHDEAMRTGLLDPGQAYLVLKDIPENHAAFAIMDAFPDKTIEGELMRRSLLWRTIFVIPAVIEDSRSAPFLKEVKGQPMIATPLMEAIATTPMSVGEAIPVDTIFAAARNIVAVMRGLGVSK